jgi:hypothetical protein
MAVTAEKLAAVDEVVRGLAREAHGSWVDYDPQMIAELATLHLQMKSGERTQVDLQPDDPTSPTSIILLRPGQGEVTLSDVKKIGVTADDDIEWQGGKCPRFRLRKPRRRSRVGGE